MDLIVTALAAGAAGGLTSTTTSAIGDAYSGLKQLLTRRLTEHQVTTDALDEDETEPLVWQARLGSDLTKLGIDLDEGVLAAAQRVLDAVQRERNSYTVNVDTNHGAAGTFTAPVTITNHPPHHPPARPGTD